MAETHTDCRAQDGITVSMIDTIITMCRLLKDRDLTSNDVREALKDLKDDGDHAYLMGYAETC